MFIQNFILTAIFSFAIFANLAGQPIVKEILTITESESKLNRPESATFSLSGEYMAVANSDGNSISVFKRRSHEDSDYDKTPCFYLKK